MIEIKIPKEVTKYEAKLVGPFTARQCITLLIVVPVIALIYINASKVMNSTISAYLCIPVGGIGALFGWVKPYGLTFEKFLKSVFINSFIAPSERLYRTDNYYDILTKKAASLSPEDEYLIDAKLSGVSDDEIKKTYASIRKKKSKKEKYHKSDKAVF